MEVVPGNFPRKIPGTIPPFLSATVVIKITNEFAAAYPAERVRGAGLKLEDLHLRLSAEEVTAGCWLENMRSLLA